MLIRYLYPVLLPELRFYINIFKEIVFAYLLYITSLICTTRLFNIRYKFDLTKWITNICALYSRISLFSMKVNSLSHTRKIMREQWHWDSLLFNFILSYHRALKPFRSLNIWNAMLVTIIRFERCLLETIQSWASRSLWLSQRIIRRRVLASGDSDYSCV